LKIEKDMFREEMNTMTSYDYEERRHPFGGCRAFEPLFKRPCEFYRENNECHWYDKPVKVPIIVDGRPHCPLLAPNISYRYIHVTSCMNCYYHQTEIIEKMGWREDSNLIEHIEEHTWVRTRELMKSTSHEVLMASTHRCAYPKGPRVGYHTWIPTDCPLEKTGNKRIINE
jgi:hypothetical protein